ncbi:MAG: cob(I)yrinic acid a,c-diamide adenosyltransferase [Gammaproteobacteria bacterium]|nr:cob(I)yrinic acid a,c-diamide adenosyltransferase [Gammaproteobacteria bacterium]MCY4210635.1 cob(I)yrinic acid a,c-diamide adenosyltransferase [Gammaproteobacteria bacterium]MCY4282610.1 cob(I)yrinic acid a,c-diamide adenosyltransferase [Gammaproteobacteria bacterium]MCY4338306.1 cob(I)yrinic acid a,c-diamide adenosyltransferase [Gammaproteobacteria bacterium]
MSENITSTDEHKQQMQEQQQQVRAKIAQAKTRRGIIIYLYGNGKGKSSSAFGTLIRSIGHGKRGAVVQFIKGKWKTGEQAIFRQLGVEHLVMGTGFTWDTQDREQDIAAAEAVWNQAAPLFRDPAYDLIVLDEITYMFKYGYLSIAAVSEVLQARPAQQNVMITGRDPIPELLEIADTISEVKEIRHAFNHGIKAQKGIEY